MKSILPIMFFTGFIAFSCKQKKEPSARRADGPTVVDVIVATAQSISSTVEANGTIVAGEYVELHPEINGRLTYLNIPEGKYVTKGTIIARINDADLRAQMGKLKVQLDLAKTTEQRYGKLLKINGINQADYDVALNQVNSLEADINVLQAQIDKTILRAPFNGIVGLRQTSPGAYVTPTSVLATIQQVNKVKVDFTVPEEYGNIIRKGDYVTVEVDAARHKKQKALIVATEPQANTTTRNLLVRALLEDGTANPGAFVKVYIKAGTDKNSVLVPATAIIPEDKDKTLVTVVQGKAKFVKVETGVRQASNVEITSGIKEGDSVVVSGVLFTRPNAPVKVRSVKELADLTL
ncbi:efflux RND transporter periplasmic adaptor subunit [Segetibacter koreensis]|uniref:efflux RND transporter periplasmic adaptor subunit n=1 Tax=Segetibacter koreensis TaxID=398037 RepID=UPI0012F765EB|nr:efflux RND transporter periplasmic adaptor subunit [Segetibacter koreensis]